MNHPTPQREQNFSRIIMNGIVKQENMMKHLLLKSKNFLQPDTMVFAFLLDSNVYSTLKTAASSNLAANTLLTEFITLLNDAKRESYIKQIFKQQLPQFLLVLH